MEMLDKVLNRTGLEPELIAEIISIGRLKKAREGQVVISPDEPGSEMPLVLSGLLKVLERKSIDEEVFLYYLEGGETCAMSITCCIEGRKGTYKVVAEQESVLWMIPIAHMDSWMARYPSFRRFVVNSYHTRFEELLGIIDSVVFHKMDERLYKYLLDTKQATGTWEIKKTHEQIARELNTSRVVISRLLKQLENEEKIEQHRNKIEIL